MAAETAQELGLRGFAKTGLERRAEFEVSCAQKIVYGEGFTQRAMSDVLNTVVPHFRYGTLDELNAVLRFYNVYANRGKPGSRLYETRGLQFHVLSEEGKRIGSPIAAARFFLKPTLDNIEARFEQNMRLRVLDAEGVRSAVDWAAAGAASWEGFVSGLEKDGIGVMQGSGSEAGRLYFVDFRNRNAYSGEALGEGYSLAALLGRFELDRAEEQEQNLEHRMRLRI